MPVHDWTRVAAGIFHDFRHCWVSALQSALNRQLLPDSFYALVTREFHPVSGHRNQAATESDQYARKASQIAVRLVSGDTVAAVIELVSPGNKASAGEFRTFVEKAAGLIRGGIHLVIADVFPPGPRDPNGVHAAIWDEIADGGFVLPADAPLTQVSYCAGVNEYEAFVEPVALGLPLPDLPLFLTPDFHLPLPLEATYQAAWAEVPARWQRVLAPQ